MFGGAKIYWKLIINNNSRSSLNLAVASGPNNLKIENRTALAGWEDRRLN